MKFKKTDRVRVCGTGIVGTIVENRPGFSKPYTVSVDLEASKLTESDRHYYRHHNAGRYRGRDLEAA